jgi:quercetin dioxygenase-like cupin family protein
MPNLIRSSAIQFVFVLATAGSGTLADPSHQTSLIPSNAAVNWQPGPASLPKGVQIAPLAGDPGQPGPFVLRVKFPANALVAPHSHATAENLTILSGNFFHALGDKVDKSRGEELTAGGFVSLPGGTNHYVWTTSESIVQVTGTGPFGLNYVNPADDPSKSQ